MDTNIKVLIVDDFASMRKILINSLNKLGITQITETESALRAWDILQHEGFDLVISDFNMPEMNGLELLTLIRGDPRLKRQKFLMITAETAANIVRDTKNLKIDGYILKPFKMGVIEEKLKSLFSSS